MSQSEVVETKPFATLTDRDLLELIATQNAQILAGFVEVQAMAAQGLGQITPLMQAMEKSPILKMMGVKLGG